MNLAAVPAAEEFLAWTLMRHPAIKSMLARRPSLEQAFQVLYMTTGYHFPPRGTRFGFRNVPLHHWRSATLRPDEMARLGPPREPATLSLRFVPDPTRMALSTEERRRLDFLAALAQDSAWALWHLSQEPRGEPDGLRDSRRAELMVRFPSTTMHTWAALRWPSGFTPDELDGFRRLMTQLGSSDAASHYLHVLNAHLAGLATEQDRLCDDLRKCSGIEHFHQAYLEHKVGRRPTLEEPAAPRLVDFVSGRGAAEVDADDLETFLASPQLPRPTEPGQASFRAISTELGRISRGLARLLKRVEERREETFRWLAWAATLGPSVASVEQFRVDLDALSKDQETRDAVETEIETQLAGLLARVDHLRETLAVLNMTEDRLSNLSWETRDAARSTLAQIAIVQGLTERAVESTAWRREVIARRRSAATTLLLAIAMLTEERLRRRERSESLLNDANYARIKDAVGAMAAAEQRSP